MDVRYVWQNESYKTGIPETRICLVIHIIYMLHSREWKHETILRRYLEYFHSVQLY